nr:PqiC family protein [uncultured Rhodopila sp.]
MRGRRPGSAGSVLLSRRLGGFAVCLSATLLAACSSPDPKLYTVASLPGTAVSGTPKVVSLHSVGIARYLQRNQIVQTSEDYRVVLRGTDWWAEPLDAMLTRVLAQDLTERLPQTTVYTSAGAVTGSPEATIEVELSRLDLDRAGNLLLIGQGSVSFKNQASPDTRSLHISQTPPSPGVEGQIAATSTAIAQVADAIAAMLADGRPAVGPGRR